MFGFPPFVTFQPFVPMQPMPMMVSMVPGCGGRGPCAANEFCDPTGDDSCAHRAVDEGYYQPADR
jgi:hypothetical protein